MKDSLSRSPRLWLPNLGAFSMPLDFAWTLGGNVAYSAAQAAVLVVLAKLGSVEMVGQFALGTAIAMPIILAANLFLRALVATDVRGEHSFADYLSLRLTTTVLAFGLMMAFAWNGSYRAETAWVIVLVGASKAFDALSDLCIGLFQQRGRMNFVGIILMVNGGVSLLALSLALWWTHNIVWATFGSLLGSVVAFGAVGLPAALPLLKSPHSNIASAFNALRPRWNPATLQKLFWRAAPLGLASLRPVLSLYLPRYFVAYFLGERALGIFAAVASFVLAGLIVASSLTLALTPRLANDYAAGNRQAFRQLMTRLVQIGVAQAITGLLVAIVAGREILLFVFGAEYALYHNLLIWMALTAGLYILLSFFEMALTAMQRFTIQMPIQLLSLGMLSALCFWLTPQYGVYGAAIAMFASALFSTVACALALLIYLRRLSW